MYGNYGQARKFDQAMRFMAEFGAPDIVIGNAGISAGTLTAERDDAPVFRRIIEVNVVALFDTFAAFLPAMRERGSGGRPARGSSDSPR